MGKNKSYGDKLFITIVYVLMGLISLVCLYPMWHVIMASFSDPIELMRHTGVILKPLGYSVEGYRVVLQNPNIPRSYMNTIFYVVLGTSVKYDPHHLRRLCSVQKRIYGKADFNVADCIHHVF